MLDFSAVHQTRIHHVTYRARVTGQTLKALGDAAVKNLDAFYGDVPYTITNLDVSEIRDPKTGAFLCFDATAYAETR